MTIESGAPANSDPNPEAATRSESRGAVSQRRTSADAGWLVAGVVYTAAYAIVGWWLRASPDVLLWFRTVALIGPPLIGVAVILRRRRLWWGCQWFFWATIAIGLLISALGFVGWTVDEMLSARGGSWLGWPAVFALFGSVAPLFALLALPHRGVRESSAATTAVDIAGIAVLAGFLYSYVVMGLDMSGPSAARASLSLVLISELQQLLVVAGLAGATAVAWHSRWRHTYLRLGAGALVGFVMLTLSNHGIWQGDYRSVFVYDFTWLLPFFFVPWAVHASPTSATEPDVSGVEVVAPSRPWIVFGVLALLPVVDVALHIAFPVDPAAERYRNLTMAVTVVSVLPLLMARLAVQWAGQRNADARARLFVGAVEQAADLIWIFSADGRVEYANPAFCRALGYGAQEVTSKRVDDLTPEYGRFDLETLGAMAEDGAWQATLTRQRKDGTTFVSASVVVPLYDRGRLKSFAAVERDVTEDTRLRAQLVESERRYRALFEEAPLGIFRASADGRLVEANVAFARLLGSDGPETLVGVSLAEIGADPDEIDLMLARWRESGLPDSSEMSWLRADGESIVLRLYGQWVPRHRGDAVLEVFAEDVTQKRKAEEEFHHAQKMEAIGRLAGGVAHDFNNQLTVILGYSEAIATQIDEEKPIWQDVAEIRRAAQNAAVLTRRLLTFSRRQVVKMDVHDLNDLVTGVGHTLTRVLGDDVVVETHLSSSPPMVRLDTVQFEQVLLNLAVNARDAMPGGGRLIVETSRVELTDHYRQPGPVQVKPGAYALLTMTDTGCGMDAETRSRVFEPFFTTKERGRGTGLGLATVYGIVKRIHGYIWVYSEPERGTTFKIYLPEAREGRRAAAESRPREPVSVGSETILVVEDEDAVRAFTSSLLRRHGYRVLEASSAEEGLTIATSGELIDLILTDVVMPGLTGPEMMAQLRASRAIPGLYMSGYTERALRDGILQSASEFIEKPFGPTELLQRVRQVLDGTAGSRPS
jgi:PAS domain S-box-containing protein